MDFPKTCAITDFSLAVTLATLGVGFVNVRGTPAQKGDAIEWREISAKLLDELGISFEDAEARGLGDIAYGFQDHPLRAEIIKEFRKARARFQQGNMEIPDSFGIKCECGKDHTPATLPILAAFAAYLFGTRKHLADRRKRAKARLRLGNDRDFSILSPKDIQ